MELRIKPQDAWVRTPEGRLFARIWHPQADRAELSGETPIVLFHDSLGSVELWRSFPERLCLWTGRPVVAYDRLGFGKSDPFGGEWSGGFIRKEATTFFPILREQLGFDPFIAIGHSVGGAMAALCAAAFPAACRALVTESAQAFVEDRTLQGILDAELKGVICPALILHGEQDEYGSVRHPMRLARAMAGATRVEILPGFRHVPHKESEATILDLIGDFLARVGA